METGNIYKVVFQLTHQDLLVHKSMIRQISNLLLAIPSVIVEVIVHGQAIGFLSKETSFKNSLEFLQLKGVAFLICEHTLKDHGSDVTQMVPAVKVIPSAIAHLIVRQHEGWAYIKAGF